MIPAKSPVPAPAFPRAVPQRLRGTLVTFACLLGLSACSLVGSEADRLFAQRDFDSARDAYVALLENRDGGRRVESALYHLGLIYLQHDVELHDAEAARSALTRLTYIRPRSEYAAKASLLLALQLEAERLRQTAEAQAMLTHEAQDALVRLREEASQTEAKSEDQSRKVGQLGERIARLEAQTVKLREELAATGEELAAREQELERLKRIDLENPE